MRYISELIDSKRKYKENNGSIFLEYTERDSTNSMPPFHMPERQARVNVLALGDVGGTVLLGLRLLGADVIGSIGMYDLNDKLLSRYEREINQVCFPDGRRLPDAVPVSENELFACDMFVFCASKGVPSLGTKGDVRMMQLKANCELVSSFAKKAVADGFTGIFAVVSDPVDPLCWAAVEAGLAYGQVQGYGLGVMNGRASYFARKETKFSDYISEGRAFGPHGEDLVIANSIANYNDELSRELTDLTIRSNLETRADGFKPYIAPAISSGATSLIETLRGGWNYSSLYFGADGKGAFMGCRNKRSYEGMEIENLPLDERLFTRIRKAYDELCRINQNMKTAL